MHSIRHRIFGYYLLCLIFHFITQYSGTDAKTIVWFLFSMSSERRVLRSEDGVAYTFKVKYEPKHVEKVCITGDSDVLGNWNSSNTIALSYDGSTRLWSVDANIPANRDVHYRYFTCTLEVVDGQPKMKVHQWETNVHPRKVQREKMPNNSNGENYDVFGQFENEQKLENGWLVDDVAVFIRLNSTSIEWISEQQASKRKTLIKLSGSVRDQNDVDMEEDGKADVIFISTSKEDGKYREQLSTDDYYSYYDNEWVVFMTRTFTLDNQGFVFEFEDYVEDQPVRRYYGHLVLDREFGGSRGYKKIPIHSSDQTHVGNLKVNYLVVRPTPRSWFDLTFKSSFAKYWNSSWTCLEIGHRGCGKSFSKSKSSVLLNSKYRENTIGSFKAAGACGAHMIEFDVQLTSDLIPTVYHDFNLLLEVQRKKANYFKGALLLRPFHELSFENLKDLEIRHVTERNGPVFFENDDGEEFVPFPSLKRVLNSVDPHIGFNIEIKHTSQSDGNETFDNPIDMNTYVDEILDVVFENAGLRYIVFSSFSRDICLMTRLKQNRYPVMFLTDSVKMPNSEERSKNIQSAIDFANSADLLGIVAEARDLLYDPSLVKRISDCNLIPFCWGEDVNNDENIEKLKKYGIHGVIFDGIEQFGQKLKNDIIFSHGML